jgi:hypothetical protein
MTDSLTYDAHNPVEWTPDHVAKIKGLNLNVDLNKDKEGKEGKEECKKTKATGWIGIPISE